MADNVLKKAKEFSQKNEWGEVYKICSDYIDSENYDEWESLEFEEELEVVLFKIESIIKSIILENLFSGKFDENKIFICSDECKEIIDLLCDSIDGLSTYILSFDDDEVEEKINLIFTRVCKMAQELFLTSLDYYIDKIGADARDSSFKQFVKYYNGYLCLHQKIHMSFIDILVYLDESIELKDDVRKESEAIKRDKLFAKVVEINEMINEAATDFPYFGDNIAAYMYIQAIMLTDLSIPEENNNHTTEINIRISRLKQMVNLICDFLNAIYVTKGQRVSLCIAEKERERQYNRMLECVKEIRKYENNYNPPNVNREKFSTIPEKNSGGCYVATCVYGSYDCPQVWTLRRYRDYTLSETWYGRTFIKIYYVISPTIVKWFGHTKWFKKMWQDKLDHMIAKLQDNGVESTPYEDKEW